MGSTPVRELTPFLGETMLLAIDIGNTNITFGLFKKNRLVKVFDVATYEKMGSTPVRELTPFLKGVDPIIEAVICSVVPSKTRLIYNYIYEILSIRSKIIGKDIKVPIKNLYKNPKQVGQDRLVVAYVAKLLYGVPAIIIDFGTAITFDYINKKGEYEGGIITPGVEISLEALYKKAALLPSVKFIKKVGPLIGKDTKQSILSGATYGLFSMCGGLVNAIKKQIKGRVKVIATGGASDIFFKYCKFIDKVDKNLILKGMQKLV